jgi:hypothetical protein
MVKLLRLKGDASKNNKEIRNIFSDSIIIKPNSRVALRSCRVRLVNEPDQEEFDLVTPQSYQYTYTGTSDRLTVTTPAGSYSGIHNLLRAIQIQANQVAPAVATPPAVNLFTSFLGVHNIWQVADKGKKASLSVYKAEVDPANFNLEWRSEAGDPILSGVSNLTTTFGTDATPTGTVFVRNPAIVPLVGSLFEFTVGASSTGLPTNVGTYEVGAIEGSTVEDPDAPVAELFLWNVKVDPANNRYLLQSPGVSDVELARAPTEGDVVRLYKRGNRAILKVGSDTARIDVLDSDVLKIQSANWGIRITSDKLDATPANRLVAINSCSCTKIQQLQAPNQSLQLGVTSPIDVTLDWIQPTTGNNTIQQYLGLPDPSYPFAGNPATLTSIHNVLGLLSYPGAMLTVLGLDLETYSGASDRQPGSFNIIDVLFPEDINNPHIIQMRANDTMKLNIKNERELLIRDLTLAFTNERTGKPLEFKDDPVVVLEIYDPEEV